MHEFLFAIFQLMYATLDTDIECKMITCFPPFKPERVDKTFEVHNMGHKCSEN